MEVNGNARAGRYQAGVVADTPDQDDFWLNQPKNINLIAFKALEQLYGFT